MGDEWKMSRAMLRHGLVFLMVLLSAECVWFGAAMLLNPHVRIAPNLFPDYGPGVQEDVGLLALAFGVGGIARPRAFGALASLMVCGWRGWQAWVTRNDYAVGVWAIFVAAIFVAAIALSRTPRKAVGP